MSALARKTMDRDRQAEDLLCVAICNVLKNSGWNKSKENAVLCLTRATEHCNQQRRCRKPHLTQ